jgi:hypothetical protein
MFDKLQQLSAMGDSRLTPDNSICFKINGVGLDIDICLLRSESFLSLWRKLHVQLELDEDHSILCRNTRTERILCPIDIIDQVLIDGDMLDVTINKIVTSKPCTWASSK